MKNFTKRALSMLLSAFLVFSLACPVFAAGALKIPSKVKYYNGHMYYVFKSDVTWEQAKKSCEKRGGHLVVISSKGEQNFVASLVNDDTPDTCIYYTGVYDASKTCQKWKNTVTGQKLKYTNWAKNQPQSPTGKAYYGAIFETDGKWVTTQNKASDSGYVALGYICEWDTGAVSGIEQVSATSSSITLSWKDNDLVYKYIIYYYDTSAKKYIKYKTVTKTSISIKGLERATTYKIAISCVIPTSKGELITPKKSFNAVTIPGKTKSLKIEDKISLTWRKVKGADGYMVYKYNSDINKWERFDAVKKNSCKIGKKFGSEKQQFKVRAFKKSTDGTRFYGGYSNVVKR